MPDKEAEQRSSGVSTNSNNTILKYNYFETQFLDYVRGFNLLNTLLHFSEIFLPTIQQTWKKTEFLWLDSELKL